MMRRALAVLLCVALALAARAQPQTAMHAEGQDAPPPELLRTLFRPGDGVLWLGGTPVAESQAARYVNTALMMARPADDLRPYVIGLAHASPDDLLTTAHRAMLTLQPTVVVLWPGPGPDLLAREPDPELAQRFGDELSQLVEAVRRRGAREVLIVSPTPVHQHPFFDGLNDHLELLARAAQDVAIASDATYLDAFDRLRDDLRARPAHGGDPWRLDEADSMVAAVDLLAQLGFTGRMLERIAFRPCPEPAMREIEERLAVSYTPDSERAESSFRLANMLLDGERDLRAVETLNNLLPPDHPNRAQMLTLQRTQVERTWQDTRMLLRSFAAE